MIIQTEITKYSPTTRVYRYIYIYIRNMKPYINRVMKTIEGAAAKTFTKMMLEVGMAVFTNTSVSKQDTDYMIRLIIQKLHIY